MLECVIDYETRSEIDLKTAGAIKYAQHESTSIICVGYKINEEKRKIWLPERGKMPEKLWEAFRRGLLIAHNAGFERAITKYCLPRYETIPFLQQDVLRSIKPFRWYCTAATAAYNSYPRSLENACHAVGIPTKKDKEGHRLMLKYCKPRKPSKNNPKRWCDDKDELRRIYRYCLTDIQTTYELYHTLTPMTKAEKEVWDLNEVINARGVKIDVETVHIILKLIAEQKRYINKTIEALTHGEIENATQRDKVLDWINQNGGSMPNLQARTVKDALEDKTTPKNIRRMLHLRQAASKTSTAKFSKMLKVIGDDHKARDLLMYGGATPTLRFSGQRLQPQNFMRPDPELLKAGFDQDSAIELIRKGDLQSIRQKYGEHKVMDVFASCVRGMLIAEDGEEFYCADFAQIEARLAFWLSGHTAGVNAFKVGAKLYEEMSADIFNMKVSEVGKDSLERFVGKESILGCQYGMGAPKFHKQCHNKGMKSVTIEMAKRAVAAYRKKHYPIPDAWSGLERSIVAAIRSPREVFSCCRCEIWCGEDKVLRIKIPSGRVLRYPGASIRNTRNQWGQDRNEIRYQAWDWGINPETGKSRKMWKEITAWGGVFFNHVTQGTARDFMVHGMKNIETSKKYKFLLSVHDEGLSSCKLGQGSVEEYVKLLCGTPPVWAEDAPISGAGFKGVRYKK